MQTILDYLKKPKATRPRTLKTLSSHISAMFQKQLGEPEITGLIAALSTSGLIVVDDTKITYNL